MTTDYPCGDVSMQLGQDALTIDYDRRADEMSQTFRVILTPQIVGVIHKIELSSATYGLRNTEKVEMQLSPCHVMRRKE